MVLLCFGAVRCVARTNHVSKTHQVLPKAIAQGSASIDPPILYSNGQVARAVGAWQAMARTWPLGAKAFAVLGHPGT